MADIESKGDRAGQILDNEIYHEAVNSARERLKSDWASSPSATEREALWHQYQVVDAVTRELKIIRDRSITERTMRERKNKREEVVSV